MDLAELRELQFKTEILVGWYDNYYRESIKTLKETLGQDTYKFQEPHFLNILDRDVVLIRLVLDCSEVFVEVVETGTKNKHKLNLQSFSPADILNILEIVLYELHKKEEEDLCSTK